jgi:uncharacterized protein YbdZ (MbtH family)
MVTLEAQIEVLRKDKEFISAPKDKQLKYLKQYVLPSVDEGFANAPSDKQDAYINQYVFPAFAENVAPPPQQANPALDFLGQVANTAIETGTFGLVDRPMATNEAAMFTGGMIGGAVPYGLTALLGAAVPATLPFTLPIAASLAGAQGIGTDIRDQLDAGRSMDELNLGRTAFRGLASSGGALAGGTLGTTLLRDALINAGFNAGEVAGVQALEGQAPDLGQIAKAGGMGVGGSVAGRGLNALLTVRNQQKKQTPSQSPKEPQNSMLEQAESPQKQRYSDDGMSNRALEDVAVLASQQGVTDKDVLKSAYAQRNVLLKSTTLLKKQGREDSLEYKERTKARQAIERVIETKTGEKTPKKDKDVTKLGYDATPKPRLVKAQKQVQATLLKQPIGQLPARPIQALPSMTKGQLRNIEARVRQQGQVLPPSQEVIDVKGKVRIPQPTQGSVPKAMTGKPAEQARVRAGEQAKATQETQDFATVIKQADAVPDDASRLKAYRKLLGQAQNKLIADPTNPLAKQRLDTVQARIDAMTETATNRQAAQAQMAQKAKIKPAVVDEDAPTKAKEQPKITPKEAGQLLTELYSGDHIGVVDNQTAYEVFRMLDVPTKKVHRDNITSSDVTRFGNQLVYNANLGRQLGMQRIGEKETLGVVITRLQKKYPNLNVASIIGGRVARDSNVLAAIAEDVTAVQKAGESLPDSLIAALERSGVTEQAKREAEIAVLYEKLDRITKAGLQNMDRAQTPEALEAAFEDFAGKWRGLESDFEALKDEKTWMDAYEKAGERADANQALIEEAQRLGVKPVEPVAPKPKPKAKAKPPEVPKPVESKPVEATAVKADSPTSYKDWPIYQDLPDGWAVSKTAGSPLAGHVFITNKTSPLNPSHKRALMPVEQPKAKFTPKATDEGKKGTRYTTPDPNLTVRKGKKGNWVVEPKLPDGSYGKGVRVADEATAKAYVAKAGVLRQTADVKAKIKDPVNPANINANASKVDQLLPLVPADKKPLVKAFFKAVKDGKLVDIDSFAEKYGMTVGDDPYNRLDYPYDADVNPTTGDILLSGIKQTDGQNRSRLLKEGQLGFVQRDGVLQIPKDTEVKSEITKVTPSDKEVMYRPSYEPDADGKPQLVVRDRDGNIVEQVEAKSVPISGWLADRLTRPEPFEKADIRRAGEEIANMPDLRQVEEVMAKFPEAQRDALRKLVTGLRCQK